MSSAWRRQRPWRAASSRARRCARAASSARSAASASRKETSAAGLEHEVAGGAGLGGAERAHATELGHELVPGRRGARGGGVGAEEGRGPLGEVAPQALPRRRPERRLGAVARVVDAQARRHRRVLEAGAGGPVEREADVLDRGDALLLELLRVEARRDDELVAPLAEDEGDVLVDPDQAVELGADRREIGDLDEERRGELALAGHELVVDVELVLERLRLADALDARHLVHLPAHRLAVLEDEGDAVADGDPARALVLDQRRAERLAHRLEALERGQVVERERLHSAGIP